jgi:dihydroxyacetone kinase DhaKLM complex PTS-EIIA-like component DhaM
MISFANVKEFFMYAIILISHSEKITMGLKEMIEKWLVLMTRCELSLPEAPGTGGLGQIR